jgi:GTP cyclohydrolase IA
MEEAYRQIVTSVDGGERLLETPRRAAEAWHHMMRGYQMELDGETLFECAGNDPVVMREIPVYSVCEHHLSPFFGTCHVGYVPIGKVLGLGAIARIVEMYSCRLQIQERLTTQIAERLMELTGARGVAVMLQMRHLCMEMHGGAQVQVVTRAVRGEEMGLLRD